MSTASLVVDGLTIEGFFDRGQVLLTLLRDSQVVTRVPRDLHLGCFALTVESSGTRWTLEADARFRVWRKINAGDHAVEGTALRGWLLAARGSRAQVARQGLVGFAGGVAAYLAVGALWSLWSPINLLAPGTFIFVLLAAAFEVYQVRQLRKHLDRQASLVVAV